MIQQLSSFPNTIKNLDDKPNLSADSMKQALQQDCSVLWQKVIEIIAAAAKAEKGDAADGSDSGVSAELLAYINERIEARRAAKASKNFAEADKIRAELLEKGITLLDTREGTKFTIA